MSDNKPLSADELAVRRTVMACDRTLMAWTRTSLSLISFGFTIYKFLQYAKEEGVAPQLKEAGPQHLAMAMIGLGVIFLLLASFQFWQEMRRLQPRSPIGVLRLSLALAVFLAVLGALAMLNVAFRMGPF
jgi:putative membrane protein